MNNELCLDGFVELNPSEMEVIDGGRWKIKHITLKTLTECVAAVVAIYSLCTGNVELAKAAASVGTAAANA
jgi:hypothetical protein